VDNLGAGESGAFCFAPEITSLGDPAWRTMQSERKEVMWSGRCQWESKDPDGPHFSLSLMKPSEVIAN